MIASLAIAVSFQFRVQRDDVPRPCWGVQSPAGKTRAAVRARFQRR
jgi:hypothetical protein